MKYLVAIHHPDDYDPSVAEDESMHRHISALNEEMIAADCHGLSADRAEASLRSERYPGPAGACPNSPTRWARSPTSMAIGSRPAI
jgi:hypothetical protein